MAAQGDHRFKSLSPQIDLPATERQILDFWDANEIFAKSVSARAGSPRWTFFEGPPTANGQPWPRRDIDRRRGQLRRAGIC